jgi:hypothetical protein
MFLAGQGTTGLGFVSTSAVSIISAFIAATFILAFRGKDTLKQHLKQNVLIVATAALVGNLFWYGAILGWDVIRTVYNDHQGLVEANGLLTKENDRLKSPDANAEVLEKQKRLTIRTELGKLLDRNIKIREDCMNDKHLAGFSCMSEYLRWRDQTRKFISNNIEHPYLARFMATVGTHMEYKSSSGSFLQGEESDAVNFLTFSGVTLDEFIREFQN